MSQPDNLATCVAGQWAPGISDPSVMGWITVGVYGLAGLLCLVAVLRTSGLPVRLFWLAMAILLLGLMVNTQLDLQTALNAATRCLSQIQAGSEDGHLVQLVFVVAIAMTGVNLIAVSFWLLRKHLRQIGLALLGFGILIGFVLIRIVGINGADPFLNAQIGAVQMKWVLEMTGILLIGFNANVAIRRARDS